MENIQNTIIKIYETKKYRDHLYKTSFIVDSIKPRHVRKQDEILFFLKKMLVYLLRINNEIFYVKTKREAMFISTYLKKGLPIPMPLKVKKTDYTFVDQYSTKIIESLVQDKKKGKYKISLFYSITKKINIKQWKIQASKFNEFLELVCQPELIKV